MKKQDFKVDRYNGIPKEAIELLTSAVDVINKEMTCNHGKAALLGGLLAEVKRHTDNKEVRRG